MPKQNHTSSPGRRVFAGLTAAATLVGTLALAVPAQAQGDGTAVHTSVVSTDPADYTPHVKDGYVASVVQVGNQIVIGGTFTQIVKGTTTFTRTGLAAFDATTGAVSTTFNPVLNGEVTSVEVASDGSSVYVGGGFSTVNGVTRKKVARVKVSDGSLVTSFKVKGTTGIVNDLRRVGGTLWMAGGFGKVDGQTRKALATVDATTGALTSQSTIVVAGQHNGGSTNIRELAASPDGTRLVAIGNFLTFDGQARRQVAVLDISGPTAVVAGWQTNFFTGTCASVFDTYLRDVAVSPDGTYVVLTTTGAYKSNSSCDTISRFELTTNASGLNPTWVNMTGGDTTTAVAIVGSVVYIGGHFRWLNNAYAADNSGQGAIAREGLAALNPVNGLPYPWNPTRERGYGVYDFLATDQGLWVGSDTDGVGGEYHPRIGYFPLAGGTTIPPYAVGTAPGDVIAVSPGAASTDAVTSTSVNGSFAPGGTSTMTESDSETWANVRGAMLVDGTLFTAWSNRLLYASPVNGSNVGARTQVNVSAGPLCTVSTGACTNAFSVDVPTIGGMFYDSGRIYYTLTNSSSLFYRYFEPQAGIVGAVRYTATGGVATLNPSRVRGMFMTGGQLYFADNNAGGRLTSIAFSGGVVGSALTVVDSSRDWRARGLALRSQPAANQDPTAVIGAPCAFLVCSFTSSASSDPDGSIVSRSWNFGDGGTSTATNPSHTYASGDTYTVTLTVTDNDGATDTAELEVTVAPAPASAVAFRASATGAGNSLNASLTAPGSIQAGDQLLLFVTANGVSTVASPAGWTKVGEQQDGDPDLVTRVYSRTAGAADAGTVVTVNLGATKKWASTLLAYSGVDTGTGPTVTSSAEPGSTAAHAAPPVSVSLPASWVVHYWADKTAGTTGWTVPGSLSQRTVVLGSGSGQVGGTTADSGASVPTGTWPGATATSSTVGGKATSFSIVLPPA